MQEKNNKHADSLLKKSLIGLESFDHELCMIKQINTIAFFYFINIIAEIVLLLLGKDALADGDLLCASHNFFIVHNEAGAVYFLFFSSYIFAYACVMWYVFYYLPKKFHLISFAKFGQRKISLTSEGEEEHFVDPKKSCVGTMLDQMIKVDEEEKEFDEKIRKSAGSNSMNVKKFTMSPKSHAENFMSVVSNEIIDTQNDQRINYTESEIEGTNGKIQRESTNSNITQERNYNKKTVS